MIEDAGYEGYEQEPQEQVQEAQAQQPEIDIDRYVQPLQAKIQDLEQRLDPDRNAALLRQQQAMLAHRRQLEELRLSGEVGDVDRGWKAVPQVMTTFDRAIGHLYQQAEEVRQWREEVQQRQEYEIEAMNHERFFAARDPEGHALLAEYPLHVARAIAASQGVAVSQEHVQYATQFMESRFGAHDSVQKAFDEMASYVRQVKGGQTQKPAAVRRFPTAVPAASSSAPRGPNNHGSDIDPLIAAMWAS